MSNLTPSRSKGEKAERLEWMQANGFNVPPFIVLSSEEIQSEAAKSRVDSFLNTFPKNTAFAVRSSVAGEDSGESSFAGIMESYLNQTGAPQILECAVRVVESANSEKARLYRLHRGLPVEGIQTSVIVQKMVFADKAGVLFTADPASGDRRKTLISAAYGSCEGVVSGLSDCDEFVVEREQITKQNIYKKKTARKTTRGGSGVEDFEVPESLSSVPVLVEDEVVELDLVGRLLARKFGEPLDIEWAIESNRIYLLQCRPISSPALKTELNAPKIVFDNSNIQESFCGVTLPLTFSFASQAYCSAYSQLMRAAGFSDVEVQKHHHRHRNMISFVRGRVYYNINNWYEGLKLLPAFKRNKADMEKMMGLERPVDFVSSTELTLWQKLAVAPRLFRTLANLVFNFSIIGRKYRKFTQRFDDEYTRIRSLPLVEMTSVELHLLLKEITVNFLKLWDTPLYNDFYVMVYNGKVTRRLKTLGLEKRTGDLLLVEGLESTAPTKKLVEIAEMISQRSEVKKLFAKSGEALWQDLNCAAPAIYDKCMEYIEAYGDRVAGELKLETTTLRQDKSFLESLIRSYLYSNRLSLSDFLSHEIQVRTLAETEVFTQIHATQGRRALATFKSDLKKLREGIFNRESMRLRRTRLFGLVRIVYREIGSRWAAGGLLSKPEDIFYLTEDEITDYFDGRAASADLKSIVEARRAEFQRYENEEIPNHIQAPAPIYNKTFKEERAESTEGALSGTGCYPGVVTADVDVRFTPGDPETLKGKILCTVRTDPGWAPVFFNIKGLIVERGSTLSHSAIIARELGIPAIVGVEQLTKRLSTGEQITMDGQSGLITQSHAARTNESQNTLSI